MSEFAVTIERIGEVCHHPNADRLDLAKVEGMSFQFIVGRDQYKVGDLVVYFPIDSLLPQEIIEKLGLVGKLHGPQKNRLKTVRLRGEISQGIVCKPEDVELFTGMDSEHADVTEELKVTKYEPPESFMVPGQRGQMPAYLKPLPDGVFVYDIEGADRHPDVIEHLMDMPVLITEKIEGSHFAAHLDADDKFVVCQRRYSIEEPEHVWSKLAEKIELRLWMECLKMQLDCLVLTVRGEVVGPAVQGNYYGLKGHELFIFEIEVDGAPMVGHKFLGVFDRYPFYGSYGEFEGIKRVPLLSAYATLREVLGDKTVQEASNGKSALCDKAREGIVIRPYYNEEWLLGYGRLIIKQRSPEYLAKTEA